MAQCAVCVFERSSVIGDTLGRSILHDADYYHHPIAIERVGRAVVVATLDIRQFLQALPYSSVPLLLGDSAISGQFFGREEIRAFAVEPRSDVHYQVLVNARVVRKNLSRRHLEAYIKESWGSGLGSRRLGRNGEQQTGPD